MRIKREVADFFEKLCVFWSKQFHKNNPESISENMLENNPENISENVSELNPKRKIPIFVLDGMAEGADQLVAEVVLELRKRPECDFLRLVAVTPMPMRFYREDFEDAETLHNFETAMTWADAVIELPLTEMNQKMYETQARIKRRPQYAQLGAFLAENSRILLALWDGMDLETASAGGTGNVVRLKVEKSACLTESLTESVSESMTESVSGRIAECGIFQVVTPRTQEAQSVFVSEGNAFFQAFWGEV